MSLRNSKYKPNYHDEINPKLPKKTNQNTPTTTETETKCCICYEETKNLKFINCKKAGIQDNIFGKYISCCGDKAICFECRSRCRESCPFCRNHTLYSIETPRFPQKKASFAEREIKRLKKIAQKLEKQRKEERLRIKRIKNSLKESYRLKNLYFNYPYSF